LQQQPYAAPLAVTWICKVLIKPTRERRTRRGGRRKGSLKQNGQHSTWFVSARMCNLTCTLVLSAGVWLLARCADLAAFSYDVTQFWYAIKVLFYIGLGSRLAACLAMLMLHRSKSV
jgi:hypothetical protein